MMHNVFVSTIRYGIKIYVKLNIFRFPCVLRCKDRFSYLFIKTVPFLVCLNGLILNFRNQQHIADKGGKPPSIEKYFFNILIFYLVNIRSEEPSNILEE